MTPTDSDARNDTEGAGLGLEPPSLTWCELPLRPQDRALLESRAPSWSSLRAAIGLWAGLGALVLCLSVVAIQLLQIGASLAGFGSLGDLEEPALIVGLLGVLGLILGVLIGIGYAIRTWLHGRRLKAESRGTKRRVLEIRNVGRIAVDEWGHLLAEAGGRRLLFADCDRYRPAAAPSEVLRISAALRSGTCLGIEDEGPSLKGVLVERHEYLDFGRRSRCCGLVYGSLDDLSAALESVRRGPVF